MTIKEEVDDLIKILKVVQENDATVFVCGNGGSAANAEHFTNDLLSRRIKAYCLSSNVSMITMIANDYGYEYVFSKQLEVLADPSKDLLIVISCSGTSPNVVEASKVLPTIQLISKGKTYGEMETRHLNIIHKAIEGFGDKTL